MTTDEVGPLLPGVDRAAFAVAFARRLRDAGIAVSLTALPAFTDALAAAPPAQLGRLYWLAVLVRLSTQLWVVSLVVRDVLVPGRDPVRAGGADDPSGGPLDGAMDARWTGRLRGAPVVPSRAA